MDRHNTIGEDLVNHCVDDIAVLGKSRSRCFSSIISAMASWSLEYHAVDRKGFARGCAANGCALIGGETAQMPGFYQAGEYDVSGTIVGVVEKSKLLNGKDLLPGDAVIGLAASSGLHTNGYSLARKIFFFEQ